MIMSTEMLPYTLGALGAVNGAMVGNVWASRKRKASWLEKTAKVIAASLIGGGVGFGLGAGTKWALGGYDRSWSPAYTTTTRVVPVSTIPTGTPYRDMDGVFKIKAPSDYSYFTGTSYY